MPPSTPEQCLERAEACERRAAETSNEDTRETMLFLENRWRPLAEEAVAKKTTTKTLPASS